jgi:hypothetical protein
MAQKWSYPWGNRSAFELDDPANVILGHRVWSDGTSPTDG